jgi:hypothetical protein
LEQSSIDVFMDDSPERHNGPGFVRTFNVAETIKLLKNGNVRILSLDNDLGEGEPEGYKVVDWMIENEIYPQVLYLHTSNPVRREYMYKMMERYAPHIKSHWGPHPNFMKP